MHSLNRLIAFNAPIDYLGLIDLTSDDDEKFEPEAHSTKIKSEMN